MSETFRGMYEIIDGYSGKSRPQYVNVPAGDLEEGMDDDQLLDYYYTFIDLHFEQNISPEARRVSEFITWAKEQIAARKADDVES